MVGQRVAWEVCGLEECGFSKVGGRSGGGSGVLFFGGRRGRVGGLIDEVRRGLGRGGGRREGGRSEWSWRCECVCGFGEERREERRRERWREISEMFFTVVVTNRNLRNMRP